MVSQKPKNFNLGILHRTKVTASSWLFLLMTFAHDIGLRKELNVSFLISNSVNEDIGSQQKCFPLLR